MMTKKKSRLAASDRRKRKLRLERFEERLLLAVTVQLDTSSNAVLLGTADAESTVISVENNGATLRVADASGVTANLGFTQDGPQAATIPVADIAAVLNVSLAGGDDSLSVDVSGGLFHKPIYFDASSGAMDRLEITGNLAAMVARESFLAGTSAGSGSWILDPDDSLGSRLTGVLNGDEMTIDVVGVEQIDSDTLVQTFDFLLTAGADDVRLEDGTDLAGAASNRIVDQGGTALSAQFANKATTRIHGLDGADRFEVELSTLAGGLTDLGIFGHDASGYDTSDDALDDEARIRFMPPLNLTVDGGLGTNLTEYGDRLEGNESLATAADLGVAPGIHRNDLNLYTAGDTDWYQFELLEADDIDVQIAFAHALGNLDLEVRDGDGVIVASSASTTDDETISLLGLAAGTYFVQVSSPSNAENQYGLSIVPGVGSSTRVLYVNDGQTTGDRYSLATGDDASDGLTPLTPKATVGSVLTDYNLGPNDLVLIDTGQYLGSTVVVTSDDEGAKFAGSPGGSEFNSATTNWKFVDADFNLVYGLTFGGSNSGIGIYAYANGTDNSTNNTFRANTFTGRQTAIRIDDGDADLIVDNTVSGSGSYGFDINYSADTSIVDNTLSQRSNGIDTYDSSLTISDNTLTDHTTAIFVNESSNSALTGVDVYGNDVSASTTGISSGYYVEDITIYGNLIHDNDTGVTSYGTVGGDDWTAGQPNDIYGNTTGVVANRSAEVYFNRVFLNQTGIETRGSNEVHHNQVYRNALTGLAVDGGSGATVINNTVYALSGDGIHLRGSTSDVTLRNNILWAEAGASLRVENDSQQGFSSDYNNLYRGGGGVLVAWQKEFTDLFDWQIEANFDSHSIGWTSLAPTLDDPQFVDLAGDDFRLTSISSTSIDGGDPANLVGAEPGDNGNRINLGAFGGTPLAATSRAAYLEIDSPNFYTDLEGGVGQVITWHSYDQSAVDFTVAGDLDIDLIEQGVGKVADIATVAVSDGAVGWTPSSLGFTGDINKRYQVRITSTENPSLNDLSREVFSIVPDSQFFYIDDSSNANDQYTPVSIGDNRNTGQSPADPKSVLLALLRSYDLDSTDSVFIDTGNYQHVRNTIISGAVGVGDDEGARFTGPNPSEPNYIVGMTATIDRGNPYADSTNIELNEADYVTLEYLTLTGGQRGLWVHNGSTNFSGDHLTVTNNAGDGLRIESDADFTSLEQITATSNGGTGIYVATPIGSLSDSVASNNGETGIFLTGQEGVVVEGNEVFSNATGISVSNNNPTPSIFGNADLSLGRGNQVYGNSQDGIIARYNVIVAGNTVYGHDGSGDSGIYVYNSAEASQNVVFGNHYGMQAYNGGTVSDNRSYDNQTGIWLRWNSSAFGNQVYSNSTGILGRPLYSQIYSGAIGNNLVYANTNHGIVLQKAGAGAEVTNNTVYQEVGDAVRVENTSSDVRLRNNILWVDEGFDIFVASDSQQGFDSDNNLLYTTGTGAIGHWQGLAQSQLVDWRNSTFNDTNSFSQDPLFVDPLGPDLILGYSDTVNDGRDDDFHLTSQHGRFTGSLAPVLSGGTGLPVMLTSVEAPPDAQQSPAIDLGDAGLTLVNEPLPNGNFINLGAYGNTVQASKSPLEYVLVTSPNGGEVWPAEQSFPVKWRSELFSPTTFVDVVLERDNDPAYSYAIVSTTENDGQFTWSIPDDPLLIPHADDYRIKVTRADNAALVDASNVPFEITEPIAYYYVNIAGDSEFSDNEYTTAAGNDANDGLSAATPKASIRAVLNAYDLDPGDTILVDTGVYTLPTNIVITADDAGVTIQGPTGAGHQAILDRANTTDGSYVFELVDADGVTIDGLGITGGYTGVFADNGSDSDDVTIQNNQIFANDRYGISIDQTNDAATIANNIVHDQTDSNSRGINLSRSPGAIASGNTVYGNRYGIFSEGYTLADRIVVSGNDVFANTSTGIRADSNVLVTGNSVHGHASGDYGIYLEYGAEASQNVVFGNYYGIQADIDGTVSDNRVYDNQTGIRLHWSSSAFGNQVYSNSTGILGYNPGYQGYDGAIENNLVYANTNHGIVLQDAGAGAEVTNNTVYQEVGDAVRVENTSSDVRLRNNILWVEEGFDIFVAPDSLQGFSSDYNLLRTTGAGKLGNWAGFEYSNLSDWIYELGHDPHSRTDDPQFVDFDGPDDLLGFDTTPIGAATILDDEDPGVTLTGSWSETEVAGSHAGDHWTTGDLADAAVWEFTGLAPGTYQVAATWSYGNYTNSARYALSEAGELKGGASLSQRYNTPSDFSDAGVDWKLLDTVVVEGNSLTVTLINADDSYDLFADAIRIVPIVGDYGSDDSFYLQNSSPAIDAGDPQSLFLAEPSPNGARTNLGRYGNTSEAAVSPAQLVQILSPNGLEKFTLGQPVMITWQSAGLTTEQQVATSNVGNGGAVEQWSDNPFLVDRYFYGSYSNAVDLSAVTDPAPESVYQTYDYLNSTGNEMLYQLPVADGSYDVRLHFAEPTTSTAGQRVFDIFLNDTLAQDDFDIVATAGARYKATTLTLSGVATGDAGLSLKLVNEATSYGALLSAIEITAANPSGVANPTVDLQWSADGGSNFTTIASGLPMDRFGHGSYAWTAPAEASQGLVRVVSNDGTLPTDDSDTPFQIANAGTTYYVNVAGDSDPLDNEYTTEPGDNTNTGKSSAAPMASLTALLNAYDLGPGDTILVDTGVYTLPTNIVITADDAGVTIQGPTGAGHQALLDRANTTDGSYVFELVDADGVTIDGLGITGGYTGVFADNGSDSDDVTIQNNQIFANDRYGISIDQTNDSVAILNNTVNDQTYSYGTGIDVDRSSGALIIGNTVYGNGTGIFAQENSATAGTHVSENFVFDNTRTGISAYYNVLVTGNSVSGHDGSSDTGIYLDHGAEARQNVVFGNHYGIQAYNDATVSDNRSYDNQTGIWLRRDSSAFGNQVYSNSTGILGSDYYDGAIENNLVYANTNHGIVLQRGRSGAEVTNNTVYQEVGDAVRVEDSSSDVRLRNNILWVDEGFDIFVASDSLQGFDSDYNLLHQSEELSSRVGFWGGTLADSLSDWRVISSQGTNSVAGDPQFVDWDGADNVLGYTTQGNGFDGGKDDNFVLAAGSPAIDRADSWAAPETDINDFSRADDEGVQNLGSLHYVAADLGPMPFPSSGTARNFHRSNSYFYLDFATLTNPNFEFPLYGTTYTSVYVTSEGFLQFGTTSGIYDQSNTLEELLQSPRIAPLWDNLSTAGAGDVYVDDTSSDRLTIRWQATNQFDDSDVNMAVTLWDSGQIAFNYGAGNTDLTPTVGISAGDGKNHLLTDLDATSTLTDANTWQFTLEPGYTDIGAFEFGGSSNDNIPPTIVGTSPSRIHDEYVAPPLSQFDVVFSESLNQIDSTAIANYELREDGPNGIFGDSDDILIALTPNYVLGTNIVTLTIADGDLPDGDYQLTISSTDGLHDESGNALDGDGDLVAGGPYVRRFGVQLAPTIPTIELVGAATVSESATYMLTLGDISDAGGVTVTDYIVNWGDGSSNTYTAGGAVTHSYPDGQVARTITVDLIDADGTHPSAGMLNLTVNNIAPTIALSGASAVNEGSPYTLTLGAVTDPGTDTVSEYIVNWGDGSSDTYTAAGDVTHSYADGQAAPTITVDLVDEDGTHVGAGSLNLTVNNVAPTASIAGPLSGVPFQERIFTLTATDPSPADQAAGFTFDIDWDGDDVVDQSVVGPSGTQVTHAYKSVGANTVKVTASDQNAEVSDVVTHAVNIVRIQMQGTDLVWGGTSGEDVVEFEETASQTVEVHATLLNGLVVSDTQTFVGISGQVIAFGGDKADIIDAGGVDGLTNIGSTLIGGLGHDTIYGGDAADTIRGDAEGDGSEGKDTIDGGGGNDLIYGDGVEGAADTIMGGDGNDTIYGDNGDISADGAEGHDVIYGNNGDDTLFGGKRNDTIFGGDGNDIIDGQTGHDILSGGAGDDTLSGGDNKDLLFAGAGADTLHGNGGEDLLVAGATSFDFSEADLKLIRSEWVSAGNYAARVANISGTPGGANDPVFLQPGSTVLDDNDVDTLFGEDGDDWFLASQSGLLPDILEDLEGSEVQTDIG